MTDDIKSRINQRLKILRIAPQAASLRVGDKPDLIRAVLRADPPNPRMESVKKIALALETNAHWLLTGRGSPEADRPAAPLGGPPAQNTGPQPVDQIVTRRDIDVMGTARGAVAGAITLSDKPVHQVWRPPALDGEADVYALYVAGDSMSPAFPPGALVFVAPNRPPRAGDTVIITQKVHDAADEETYIKIFRGENGDKISLYQHKSQAEITVPRSTVLKIHRVLTTAELFGL